MTRARWALVALVVAVGTMALVALAPNETPGSSEQVAATPPALAVAAPVDTAEPEVPAVETVAATEATTTTVAPTTTIARSPLETTLVEQPIITGDISPKSVVASGTGLVFAQNMIYNHTVTVYRADGSLAATISDAVRPSDFGIADHTSVLQGGPVEVDFTSTGRHAYVSNYSMYGPGYGRPGDDKCSPESGFDDSFVYRIDTESLTIDQVIAVGSVPKYVQVTPDDRYVLVSNWCSYDLSVIDVATGVEVRRVPIGRYPRGIAVSPGSDRAYVAAMGTTDVAVVSLADFSVGWINGVGTGPRHLVLSPDGGTLYATLNRDGRVAKVDLGSGSVVARVSTGSAPRSMDISADGSVLYVVNYESNTMSKVRTSDMSVMQELPTRVHPIGITVEPTTNTVWVASYRGAIHRFAEQ